MAVEHPAGRQALGPGGEDEVLVGHGDDAVAGVLGVADDTADAHGEDGQGRRGRHQPDGPPAPVEGGHHVGVGVGREPLPLKAQVQGQQQGNEEGRQGSGDGGGVEQGRIHPLAPLPGGVGPDEQAGGQADEQGAHRQHQGPWQPGGDEVRHLGRARLEGYPQVPVEQAVHIAEVLLEGGYVEAVLLPGQLLDDVVLDLAHIALGRVVALRRVLHPDAGDEEIQRHHDEENENRIEDALEHIAFLHGKPRFPVGCIRPFSDVPGTPG